MNRTRLNVSVTTENPEVLTRAIEMFGRSVAGLAMEGVQTFMMCGPDEDDEED